MIVLSVFTRDVEAQAKGVHPSKDEQSVVPETEMGGRSRPFEQT